MTWLSNWVESTNLCLLITKIPRHFLVFNFQIKQKSWLIIKGNILLLEKESKEMSTFMINMICKNKTFLDFHDDKIDNYVFNTLIHSNQAAHLSLLLKC